MTLDGINLREWGKHTKDGIDDLLNEFERAHELACLVDGIVTLDEVKP